MNNRPGSGQVPHSPPIDFPVYGLDASWPGSRWLEMFGDVIGGPVRWISLGHQSLAEESVIFVQTYSRPLTDIQAAEIGQSPLEQVAAATAFMLINVTLPVESLPRPAGLDKALTEHADEHSSQYAQWPTVRWRVAAQAVAARVWHFAGGWAGFSDAADGVYLAAVGVGAAPEDLSLALLQDGSAYHFDLDRPLQYSRVLSASKAARTDGDRPLPHREDWHADQLQIMRDLT
jgi:hypothetical protein